jgi:Predicted Rossmann fold nucleotide-binding protein
MIQSICVFASSSNDLDNPYYECAAALGRGIAERGLSVVFGGGADGLMGALARGAAQRGGTSLASSPTS